MGAVKLMTMREAGLPMPDLSPLRRVRDWLRQANPTVPVWFYGGYLRDLMLLGHVNDVGDLDAAMWLNNYLALKPPLGGYDVRRDWALHEPHLLFMLHQLHDGVFEDNPRPVVLKLKGDLHAQLGLTCPLGMTLLREPVTVDALLADTDLGFSAIASDGEEVWVTPTFVQDAHNRTMTMVRCRDARDYARTLQRVGRLTASRYAEWTLVVPPEFAHLAPPV